MASKQDNAPNLMEPHQKKLFFEDTNVKHKELSKRQREYKEILGKRHKTRGETIIEKSLWTAIDALQQERNDLRAQIWVADGAQHIRNNERSLKEIECHVNCQQHLAKDIGHLKVAIANMEREVSRVDREIYELNRQIVPETQHQEHVARTRKKLGILENQLEVGVRRECIFSAQNAQLRGDLENILHDRAKFNNIYTKMVNSLNSDKKYMVELMEFALNSFENCINVSEKTDLRLKKVNKEHEARKAEVQGLIRTFTANQVMDEFVGTKAKVREIAPLQPKEAQRRANYRHFHTRRINLYTKEIEKLLHFTDSHNVFEVIERYQQQESLYYSYFTLDNEREFHITLLNNSVDRLFNQVEKLKEINVERMSAQLESIGDLDTKLEEKRVRTQKLGVTLEEDDKRLTKFLGEMQTIMIMCRLSNTPLLALLGDHTRVSLENMQRFSKLLENRLMDIVASVYVSERADPHVNTDKYVIKDIEKTVEAQTKLPDIVLTQQCPECAEGEAFTADDTGDGWAAPLSVREAKKALFDKVNQPEMQYRLHSISQCRLPRSRILAAKRNT